MSDLKKYHGVIPAFYACYDEEGNISPERVRGLTRHLIGKAPRSPTNVYTCPAQAFSPRLNPRSQVSFSLFVSIIINSPFPFSEIVTVFSIFKYNTSFFLLLLMISEKIILNAKGSESLRTHYFFT